MAWIDWAGWPLVEVDVCGGRDPGVAMHGALAGGLERDEPFVLIVSLDAQAARAYAAADGAVDERTRRWRERVGVRLRTRCRGVAYVSAAGMASQWRALAATRAALGCHVEAFDDAAAARAWAHGRLAGYAPVMRALP